MIDSTSLKLILSKMDSCSNIRSLLSKSTPITEDFSDKKGRTIKIWRNNTYGFFGTVQSSNSTLKVVLSDKIINPCDRKSSLPALQRIAAASLRMWHLAYDDVCESISLFPKLIAAGNDDIPQLPTHPSQIKHIFSGKKILRGHFPTDTRANRAALVEMCANPKNRVATDNRGNGIYLKQLPNGSQLWGVVSRKGMINDGGINFLPKRWGRDLPPHVRGGAFFDIKALPPPAKGSFEDRTRSNNLVKSYNASHQDNPMDEAGTRSGHIGGVGNEVGIIYGLFNDFSAKLEDEHAFFVPATNGTFSLSQERIQQLLRELAVGIFVYDTVPFFSLHFNNNTDMYPVIHPCYANTYIGYVISMLDYYMKGFLNGGFFDAATVESWCRNPNMSESALKEHIIDFRSYCRTHLGEEVSYYSVKELLRVYEAEDLKKRAPEVEEDPLLKDYSGFRSSFRIIAKQRSINKTENLFVLDGGFDVLYTIEPDPAYLEELNKYRQITGDNPPSYKRLERVYEEMSRRIKTIMPRLPHFKELFEALNLINFFSFYFNTLKKESKVPHLNTHVADSSFRCPPLFPHLPIREFAHQDIQIGVLALFNSLPPTLQSAILKLANDGEMSGALFDKCVDDLCESIKRRVLSTVTWTLPDQYSNVSHYNTTARDVLRGFINARQDALIHTSKTIETVDKLTENLRELIRQADATIKTQEDALRNCVKPKVEVMHQKSDLESRTNIFDPNYWSHIGEYTTAKKNLSICTHNLEQIEAEEVHLRKQIEDLKTQKKKFLADLDEHIAKKNKLQASLTAPFEIISEEALLSFPMSESIFRLFSEEPIQQQAFYKRIVGGCGLHLDRQVAHIDPKSFALLDRNFPGLSHLPAQALLPVSSENGNAVSGVMFKLEFSSFSTSDPTEKFYALGLFSNPSEILNETTQTLFSAVIASDEQLFTENARNRTEWNRNALDLRGVSLLHYAACSPNSFFLDFLLRENSSSSIKDPNGYTPLHYAAQAGIAQNVQKLLMYAPGSIDSLAEGNVSPLYVAAQNNRTNVVKVLLGMGADPNIATTQGMPPLMCAIHRGHSDAAIEIIGCSRTRLDLQLDDGTTALHLAIDAGLPLVVKALVAKKCDANLARWDGHTPVHLAAKKGDKSIFECIIRTPGVQLNARLKSGKTALHLAAQEDHHEIVSRLLERGADPALYGWDRETPLSTAIQSGAVLAAQCLLQHTRRYSVVVKDEEMTQGKASIPLLKFENRNNMTPIKLAGAFGMTAIWFHLYDPMSEEFPEGITPFQFLIDCCRKKVDIAIIRKNLEKFVSNTSSEELRTLGLTALASGHDAGVGVIIAYHADKTMRYDKWSKNFYRVAALFDYIDPFLDWKFMKQAGFLPKDVDIKDIGTMAAISGSHKCLALLFDIFGSIMKEDRTLMLSLLKAAVKAPNVLCLDVISTNIVDLHLYVDENNQTICHEAALRGNRAVLEWLRTHGGRFDVRDVNGKTPLHIFVECDHKKALTDLLDPQKRIQPPLDLLHYGAAKGSVPMLLTLLKFFSTLDEVDPRTGCTPMTAAIQANKGSNVAILCERGANINGKDKEGMTPCLKAAACGRERMFSLFPSSNLLTQVTPDGQNALHLAAKHGHDSTVDTLLSRGLNLSTQDTQGLTPRDLALANQQTDIVLLFDQGRNLVANRKKAVVDAIKQCDWEAFKRHIADFPLNRMISFEVDGRHIKTPLLLLIYQCARDDASRCYFMKAFAQIPGVQLDVRDEFMQTWLHLAARSNQSPIFPDFDVFATDQDGETPLHLYAESDNSGLFAKIVEMALQSKRDNPLIVYNDNRETPLYYAIRKLREKNALLLIEKGSNRQGYHRNKDLMTAFGLAAEQGCLPVMKALAKNDKDINRWTGLREETALHIAVRKGFDEIAKWLISANADVSRGDRSGVQPIHIAAREGNVRMVRFLQACGASIFATDNKGRTIAHYAAQSDNSLMLDYIVRQGVSLDQLSQKGSRKNPARIAPLHFAVQRGKETILRSFSLYGANFAIEDSEGDSALYYSVKSGNQKQLELFAISPLMNNATQRNHAISLAIGKDDVPQLRILLGKHSNLDQRLDSHQGYTMLHLACVCGALRVLNFLLDEGADPNLETYEHTSPFTLAVLHSHEDIAAKLALECNLEISTRMNDGNTYLHVASAKNNIAMIALLVSLGIDVNAADGLGQIALHIAAKAGLRTNVKMLICCGADPHKKNIAGQTVYDLVAIDDPAMAIVIHQYEDLVSKSQEDAEDVIFATLQLEDMENFLLFANLEGIEQRNKQGRTPLHIATTKRNFALLRRCLEMKPNLEAKDSEGKTALFVAAIEVKDPQIFDFLIKCGASPRTVTHVGLSLIDAINQELDRLNANHNAIIRLCNEALKNKSS